MRQKLARLPHELGPLGLASLAVLAGLVAFQSLVMTPMQARNAALEERVARQAPSAQSPHASASDKLAAVYAFLRKDEQATDWLAKLHGIGAATGVQLKSANYRTQPTQARIVRYEMVLPVTGSYPQIREFLKRSLAEIPVMSIDQISLKRQSRSDGAVQAELRLTLHMVNP